MNKHSGFTLLELLIAVVIVGIIASYAFMNTSDSIKKAHRAEAKSLMLQVANQEERYFTENNTYGAMKDIGNATTTLTTDSGKHTISVVTSNSGAGYTITATPVNTDAECGALTLTQTGAQGSAVAGNCW